MNNKEKILLFNNIFDYTTIFLAFFITLLTTLGQVRVVLSFFLFFAYIYKTWKSENKDLLAKRNLVFFSFACLALLSSLWSDARNDTIKASIELFATCFVGLYLGSTRTPEKILQPISDALAVYILFSLLFGAVVGVGNNGETAVTGIGGGAKNFFSDSAISGLIFSATSALIDIDNKNYKRALKSLFVVPLCVFAVLKSDSAGGTVTMAVSMAVILYFFIITKLSSVEKIIVCILTLLACGILYLLKDQIMDFIFHTFHKEKTLTGRAYLWYRASFYMHDRPLLGRGYFAFWSKNNSEAVGLLSYFGMGPQSAGGFSFHNTFIELMVEMGYLGPIIFVSIVTFAVIRYLKFFLAQKYFTYICGLTYIAYLMSRSGVELVSPVPFNAGTLLMFLCFGMSFMGSGNISLNIRYLKGRR